MVQTWAPWQVPWQVVLGVPWQVDGLAASPAWALRLQEMQVLAQQAGSLVLAAVFLWVAEAARHLLLLLWVSDRRCQTGQLQQHLAM